MVESFSNTINSTVDNRNYYFKDNVLLTITGASACPPGGHFGFVFSPPKQFTSDDEIKPKLSLIYNNRTECGENENVSTYSAKEINMSASNRPTSSVHSSGNTPKRQSRELLFKSTHTH